MPETRTFTGSSIVYEYEMDGGEGAMERAARRAFVDADLALPGGFELLDTQVNRVLGYGPTKYIATVTVEEINE